VSAKVVMDTFIRIYGDGGGNLKMAGKWKKVL